MSSGVLFGLSQGVLDVFVQAIDAARMDIEAARFDEAKRAALAKDLEGFIRSCVDMNIPHLLRLHRDSILKLIAANAPIDFSKSHRELRDAFAQGRIVLGGLVELTRLFQETGGSLKSVDDLEIAAKEVQQLDEVRQLEDSFFPDWSPLDPDALAEARRAFERGECLDLDDAFAQIKGVSREAWLQMVAKRNGKASE